MKNLGDLFRNPHAPLHIQYEALRAHFVDGLDPEIVADRFGYSAGTFRNLCSRLRKNPNVSDFFAVRKPGPKTKPEEPFRQRRERRILELRRTAPLSVKDIRRTLAEEGLPTGTTTVQRTLHKHGIAKLRRRSPSERDNALKPIMATTADVRAFQLEPRSFRTEFGGLFLFVRDLIRLDLDRIVADSALPGSTMLPAAHMVRALLALKLWGIGRPPHMMPDILDPGMALFAGLNAFPKRSSLTEYAGRVDPKCCVGLMDRWYRALNGLETDLGGDGSFDLDFHTIPWHGKDAETPIEKHSVSKRSRRQKGILAFLARDAEARLLVYANARVRKADHNDEILRFIAFWHERNAAPPRELVFDSRLTTHANLWKINQRGIDFLTLRKRSASLLATLAAVPSDAWKHVRLNNVGRLYRTPRVLDQTIRISNYPDPIRQLAVRDLGHEKPTLLLTNQRTTSISQLIDRYARRMVIENAIADAIDFFHMDALSAAVPMKVDLDLQLTLIAGGLYRLLAVRLGNGKQNAKSRTLFRDFIKAPANVTISDHRITVRLGRRANNPFLLNADYNQTNIAVPWLHNHRLQIDFL